MDADETVGRRLHAQHLEGPKLASPAEVVRRLLAVQAQDYGPAKWSVGERTDPSSEDWSDAALDRALADGTILRTHVLRPTWHFVLPEDIVWLQELTAPRVHAFNKYHYKQHDLEAGLRVKATDLIAEALTGRVQLTRKQVQALLAEAGIVADGPRLAHILMFAELEAVICSGALAGKQHTYALLSERAPGARRLDRDEALAELTLRYLAGHGPATVKDLRWWSSLVVADVRAGLDAVGDRLEHADVNGTRYWWLPSDPPPPAPAPVVHLLQGVDDYFVAYSGNDALVDPAGYARRLPRDGGVLFNNLVVVDGRLAGHWKRTAAKGSVLIEVALYDPFDDARHQALRVAAGAFAAFLGTEPILQTRAL